jgi:hypothetical protein
VAWLAVHCTSQCAGERAHTDDAMRLHRHGRSIFFAPVLQQGPDVAFVIDLDGLLRRRRMVARRGRLEDEPVDGSEDEQLADQGWHLISGAMRFKD